MVVGQPDLAVHLPQPGAEAWNLETVENISCLTAVRENPGGGVFE